MTDKLTPEDSEAMRDMTLEEVEEARKLRAEAGLPPSSRLEFLRSIKQFNEEEQHRYQIERVQSFLEHPNTKRKRDEKEKEEKRRLSNAPPPGIDPTARAAWWLKHR